jgi:hypothetical protein
LPYPYLIDEGGESFTVTIVDALGVGCWLVSGELHRRLMRGGREAGAVETHDAIDMDVVRRQGLR